VALGDRLYHDVRLSGDDTLSCASCHDLAKGGTDQAPVSTGIRGQLGPINAPTTFNSGFQFAQFWDGRAATLEEQAGGPVENPLEMGAQWPDVIAKLEQDAELMETFLASYPEMSAENVQHAIAEFERTLVTPDSDFDRYLRGDADAMSAEAQRGYALFTQHGCSTCHVGRILGGQSYERMGYRKDYFASLEREVTDADHGRYAVTKNEMDMHKFKVPTLLNVEVTFPYFHDAATSDLGEAVAIMSEFQAGVTLAAKDNDDLVAFLIALTGKYQGEKLQ
jgi:cytochrome c peroxidase